jgi:hypothetical protein
MLRLNRNALRLVMSYAAGVYLLISERLSFIKTRGKRAEPFPDMYTRYRAEAYFKHSSAVVNAEEYAIDFDTVCCKLMKHGVSYPSEKVRDICFNLLLNEDTLYRTLAEYGISAIVDGRLIPLMSLLKRMYDARVTSADIQTIFGRKYSPIMAKIMLEFAPKDLVQCRAELRKIEDWALQSVSLDRSPTDPHAGVNGSVCMIYNTDSSSQKK